MVSSGVKTTDSLWFPAASTAPKPGLYSNVPGTDASAHSCVALSCVPYVIGSGVGHWMADVALDHSERHAGQSCGVVRACPRE